MGQVLELLRKNERLIPEPLFRYMVAAGDKKKAIQALKAKLNESEKDHAQRVGQLKREIDKYTEQEVAFRDDEQAAYKRINELEKEMQDQVELARTLKGQRHRMQTHRATNKRLIREEDAKIERVRSAIAQIESTFAEVDVEDAMLEVMK